jgi:hypothetical protein
MTRAELLELLTVERFAPPPGKRPLHVHTDGEAAQHLGELSEAIGGHLDVVECNEREVS